MNLSHLATLVAWTACLQLTHWHSPTVTNQHRVLGELYEFMTGKVDEFAEVAMGKIGRRAVEPAEFELSAMKPEELLIDGLAEIGAIRIELKAGEDDDLLNLLGEMSAAINRTRYQLQP